MKIQIDRGDRTTQIRGVDKLRIIGSISEEEYKSITYPIICVCCGCRDQINIDQALSFGHFLDCPECGNEMVLAISGAVCSERKGDK